MSTINYTYNVIVDRFRQFADGHFQLRRFTHGEISQADLEKEAEWPWMHVKPRAINYSPGTRAFSFEIFISDLPRDKEDKTGYQAESITDCSLIFQDLINEIHLGQMFGDDVVLTRPVNSEPFVEQYTHTLTGVTGIIELSLDYDWSACSIPASWNYNTPTDSPSDGWGALQFIESLDQNGVFVSLLNDLEAPGNSYYYGTNASGVKGWYAIVDNIGLTCETLPDCPVIIGITEDIVYLLDTIALKANTADLGATAFSNDYNDLDNLPTIPAAQVNSDWNATSGVAEILNKPTIPTGTVTSVGLTMPSAFSVANSPITSSGDIAVTGAGVVSQYVRGDGSLANFPSSTGGGASLSFYLNGSVAQGTFGGVAFKEMDRTPVFGAGTDFTINANGYIQSFITDANVPNLLEIPAGNWNFETYFSASSSGGSPSFYIELYKWNGATLSLIASNSATPEGITNGTAIDLYVSALAVPQTTLAATDRLAVRIYVTHSGRTIKLHTENSHLCQVITTFSTGLTALNGLTAQVQNFATGTSGTDFGISSATSTHTFNLPTASAANRGALSSADWSAFNGKFTLPALTSGSVLFSNGTTIAQDNANLFWDDTNNRLGIGTTSPTRTLDVRGIITTQNANVPSFSANGSIFASGSNVSSMAGVLMGVNIPYVTGAYGGHAIGYSNTAEPKWLIGISRNLPQENALIYYENSSAASARLALFPGGNFAIGTTTDAGYKLDVNGSVRTTGSISAASAVARGTYLNQTLVATANSDSLAALEINPTFTNGAFTGVKNNWINLVGNASVNFTNQLYLKRGDVDVLFASSVETQLKTVSSSSPLKFFVGSTSQYAQFFATTGNLTLQNGGTFTDAGYRLDVNGTARVQSSSNANFTISESGGAIGDVARLNIVGNGGSWGTSIRFNVASGGVNNRVDFYSSTTLRSFSLYGPNGNVLINTTTDIASSKLTIESTTQGVLFPRMTTTQKNAIASPAAGLVVFDTTLGKLCVFSTTWQTVTSV